MLIRFIWVMIFLTRIEFVNAHVVCMDKEVNNEMIIVNCTVDDFLTNIDFKFPNDTGSAYCSVPLHSATHGDCKCYLMGPGVCNITQNILTKTTTIQIRNTSVTDLFGWYTCAHGSHAKSLMVDRYCACRPDNDDDKDITFTIIIWTVIICLSGCICSSSCVFPNIPVKIRKWMNKYWIRMRDQQAYALFKPSRSCATCYANSICALCKDCDNFYCETCCEFHLNDNTEHRVCQIQHVTTNHAAINCDDCYNLAVLYCEMCRKLFCLNCTKFHEHKGKEIVLINQPTLAYRRQSSIDVTERLYDVKSISITTTDGDDPVRICGIGYLGDNMCVAVDGNNRQLIIFQFNNDRLLKKTLINEPCAMTSMTGNEIAVTFPYEKHIRIYSITENIETIELDPKIIDMNIIGLPKLKPFSIAYHAGYFAVEVGEGEDGMFIIVNIDEKKVIERFKYKYAYFTGHTIRLALNMTNISDQNLGRLYVSAMGKKMVSCCDLKGNKLWHKSMPGPRSIIVYDDDSSDESILLCSRRCDAIYQLTKHEQHDEEPETVKAKDKIMSPRYMAYHSNKKELCVLVAENENDKLVFLKFNT